MTIAKTVCGLIAVVCFGLKAIGVQIGTLDLLATGLFFLGIVILPL